MKILKMSPAQVNVLTLGLIFLMSQAVPTASAKQDGAIGPSGSNYSIYQPTKSAVGPPSDASAAKQGLNQPKKEPTPTIEGPLFPTGSGPGSGFDEVLLNRLNDLRKGEVIELKRIDGPRKVLIPRSKQGNVTPNPNKKEAGKPSTTKPG